MNKKLVVAIAVIAVVAAALAMLSNQRAQGLASLAEYETVPVLRDTIVATVNASGTVNPKEQINLTFPSGGLLAQMDVQAGQRVEAGQELAKLDTRQLALSVAQAEATVQINEARLGQTRAGSSLADIASAQAAVASAQAAYDGAKRKLDLRSDQLSIVEADLKRAELALQDTQAAYDLVAHRSDIGVLPQAAALERATLDYQRALANYNLQVAAIDDTTFKGAAAQLAQAKAQLDRLKRAPTSEELAIAEAQVMQAKVALEQAMLRLDDAILTAPFAGTVLATNAQAGEFIGAAVPVVILADLNGYYVDTSIDETDIGRVQMGQDAAIALDAFPDVELHGTVTRIEPLGQITQGVVSYDVWVQVLSTELPLRPNMTAIVDIVVDRKEGVLVVPNRAVKRDNRGRIYVEILEEGEAKQHFVTTGLSNELVTEIVGGVDDRDQVVVSAPRENVLEQFGGGFPFGGRG